MKEDSVRIIQSWLPILKEFIDPVLFIESLPRLFRIGSPSYSKVTEMERQPYEAVKIAIDVVVNSDTHFDDVTDALSKSGHKWLAYLMNDSIADSHVEMAAEQVSRCVEIKEKLTFLAPHIKKAINGLAVAQQLHEQRYGALISDGNLERIECRSREEGNEASVRLLLSILMRCEPGWWYDFTRAVQEFQYDDELVSRMKDICSISENAGILPHADQTSHGLLKEMVQEESAALPATSQCDMIERRVTTEPTGKCVDADLSDEMSKVEYQDYVIKYLTRILPELTKAVDPVTMSAHLKAKEILLIEDDEKVNAQVRIDGNVSGVRTLNSILLRKPIGWMKEFKLAAKEQNYSKTVRDLLDGIPDDPKGFLETSSSSFRSFRQNSPELENKTTSLNQQASETSTFIAHATETDTYSEAVLQKENSAVPVHVMHQFSLTHVKAKSENPVHVAKSIHQSETQSIERGAVCENAIIYSRQSKKVYAEIIKRSFSNCHEFEDRKICIVVPENKSNVDSLKTICVAQSWPVQCYNVETSVPLREIMQKSQIVIISTARSLLEWLRQGNDIDKIAEFDVLVFDECERASDNSPEKEVLLSYLHTKQNSRKVPQVIGLAKSFGNGKNPSPSDIERDIEVLLALFNVQDVEVQEDETFRSPSKAVLSKKKSVNRANYIDDPFVFYLCKTIDSIVDQLYKLQIQNIKDIRRPLNIGKGTNDYLIWCKELIKKADLLEDMKLQSDIKNCAKFLYSFNVALLIKTKCRPGDAANFLSRDLKSIATCMKDGKNLRVMEQRLLRVSADAINELKRLPYEKSVAETQCLNQIKSAINGRKSGRILIFVEEAEIVEPLELWVKEDIELQDHLSKQDKKDNKRSSQEQEGIIVVHPGSTIRFDARPSDFLVCYNCNLPSQFEAKGKSKMPESFMVKSNTVTMNEKVKFCKNLEILHAMKRIRQRKEENSVKFIGKLHQLQTRLMS